MLTLCIRWMLSFNSHCSCLVLILSSVYFMYLPYIQTSSCMLASHIAAEPGRKKKRGRESNRTERIIRLKGVWTEWDSKWMCVRNTCRCVSFFLFFFTLPYRCGCMKEKKSACRGSVSEPQWFSLSASCFASVTIYKLIFEIKESHSLFFFLVLDKVV